MLRFSTIKNRDGGQMGSKETYHLLIGGGEIGVTVTSSIVDTKEHGSIHSVPPSSIGVKDMGSIVPLIDLTGDRGGELSAGFGKESEGLIGVFSLGLFPLFDVFDYRFSPLFILEKRGETVLGGGGEAFVLEEVI